MDKKKFLEIIKQVESSNGTNFNHPIVTHGKQRGDQAIGNYGLMPDTVDDMARQMKLQPTLVDNVYAASQMDEQAKKNFLETNPEAEARIAEKLASKVLNKFKDPDKAAYAWKQGQNVPVDTITDEAIERNDTAGKFRKIRKMLEGFKYGNAK